MGSVQVWAPLPGSPEPSDGPVPHGLWMSWYWRSLDAQFVHCTTKLGITIAACGVFIVDSEDAGFTAVQRQGFEMLFQVAPGGFKIGESGLRTDKQKLHQAARRIINVNFCSKRWSKVAVVIVK